MESKIQPILCCVGSAVAGRPTQFLMERAFEAAHCDWRVITVEVQPASFQTALDGMQAMAFTALRFFPELQPLAATRMLEPPHSAIRTVTSAMRTSEMPSSSMQTAIKGAELLWDCWDNQGFGLLDLISSAVPAVNLLVWLHGRSRLTQSLFDAMQATSFGPNQIIWSLPEVAVEEAETSTTTTSVGEAQQRIKDALAGSHPITHLVVVGEGLAEQLGLIRDLEVIAEVQLLIATNQLLTRQQVNEAWPRGKSTIFTENDQLIAAEAYDFRRWTGQRADMDLLRDAYDEYADF